MAVQRVGDLEIGEDIAFERKEWRFQRIGTLVLLGFVLLSGLGLTGSGPLSAASVTSADGLLSVRYDRFDRMQAPSKLRITLSPAVLQEHEIQIWVDSDYLSAIQLEQIMPEPESVEIGDERLIFTFSVSAESMPSTIEFEIRPDKLGLKSAHLGIVDGSSISFRSLILP